MKRFFFFIPFLRLYFILINPYKNKDHYHIKILICWKNRVTIVNKECYRYSREANFSSVLGRGGSGISEEHKMGYMIQFRGRSANFWAELDLNQRRHIANEFTVRPH